MERTRDSNLSLFTHDGRRKYVTPGERQSFVVYAETHPRDVLGTLCLVLAYTGCRISEALALRVANIDVAEGLITFRSLKKRKRIVIRAVPIPPDLIARFLTLHHVAERDPQARLFPWSRGRAWFLVKQVLFASGCAPGPHATCKGLRHGFGIHALRNDVPINLVKRWLGHDRIATTEIYLDAIGKEEREFASRMWGPDTSTPSAHSNDTAGPP